MSNVFRYIPPYLLDIVSRLESCGFEAYLVGGCVRDELMGRTPDDYDITSSARPDELCRVFSDYRIIETGIKHGTVTVCCDDGMTEITTFRIDGEYHDCRRPDSVSFTRDVTEDLSRRDFTVNAMAYSPTRGLCDPFGGERDIAARRIVCVGEPQLRFSEDALRIMRAVRFSSVLGFEIEENSAAAARRMAHLLDGISRERIFVELSKLLCGIDAPRVLADFPDIISSAVPSLSEETICRGGEFIGSAPRDAAVRLALLCAIEDPHAADRTAHRVFTSLKSSVADRRRAEELCAQLPFELPTDDAGVRRLMSRMPNENIQSYATLRGILFGDAVEDFLKRFKRVRESSPCVSISGLAVGGNDVMSLLGVRGQTVGKLLSALLERVIDGDVQNTREALTEELYRISGAESENN